MKMRNSGIRAWYRAFKGPMKTRKQNLEINKGRENYIIKENINGLKDKNIKDLVNFQVRILSYLKYLFFYPLMILGTRIAGKHLVKEIPEGNAFNNLRADDKAWNQALITWYDTYLQEIKEKKTLLKRLKEWYTRKSCVALKLIHRLKMTLLLSDSAYQEFYNIYLLEAQKEMNKLQPDDPVHILYKNKKEINDPIYFMAINEGGMGILKERVRTLKPYYDKNGTLKTRYVGDTLTYTIKIIANELDCAPNKELMINQIRNIKQQNNQLKQTLLEINQRTVNALQPPQNAT